MSFGKSNASAPMRFRGYQAQSSVYGGVVPLIYGTQRVPTNVLWYGDFQAHRVKQSKGGKGIGKPSSAQYTYTASIVALLCQGPVVGLLNSWEGKIQLYAARVTETFVVPTGGGTHGVSNASNFLYDHGVGRTDAYSLTGVNDYGSPGAINLSGNQQTPMQQVNASPGAGQYTADGAGNYTFSASDQGKSVQITYTYWTPTSTGQGSSKNQFSITLFTGTLGQAVWGYLATNHAAQAIGYSELAYIANSNQNLGSSATMPNLTFEVQGLLSYGAGILDCNPRDVVVDMLTDPYRGLALPMAFIGNNLDWSKYSIANGLFISALLDSQRAASDWIKDFLAATNGEAVLSGDVIKFISYGDTTAVGNGVTYSPQTTPIYNWTDDDFLDAGADTDPIIVTRPTVADAFNSQKIEWKNRGNAYNVEPVEESDDAAIATYGLRAASPLTYHFITTPGVAQKCGNIVLKRNVYVRSQYKFKLPQRYILADPMDVATITDAALGLNQWPVRIISIEEDDKGDLEVTAEQFPWSIGAPTVRPKQPVSAALPVAGADPGNINTPIIWEPPNRPTVQQGYQIWFGISGLSPNWGGCTVWMSADGTTYKAIGKIFDQARMGVLTTALPMSADPDTTDTVGVDLTESNGILASGTQADADNDRTLCLIGAPAGSTQLASDNFTRANENPLSDGGSWVIPTGATALQVVSDLCEPASLGGFCLEVFTSVSFPNDQYSEVTVGASILNGAGLGPIVRAATGSITYYYGQAKAGNLAIYKEVSGTITQLGSNVVATVSAGDVIRLEVQGTTLTLKQNGVAKLTVSDSSIASGSPGIWEQAASAVTDTKISLWAGGSIGGGSSDYELITYETATLTAQAQYNLTTYLRRGRMGTSNVAHASGENFLRIDQAGIALHNTAIDALNLYCAGPPKPGEQAYDQGGPCSPQKGLQPRLQSALGELNKVLPDIKALIH